MDEREGRRERQRGREKKRRERGWEKMRDLTIIHQSLLVYTTNHVHCPSINLSYPPTYLFINVSIFYLSI